MSTISDGDKQAMVVHLLLTTLGNSRHARVLSNAAAFFVYSAKGDST